MNFSKNNTLAIKGIAILFMLCRHLLIYNKQPVNHKLNMELFGSTDLYLLFGLSTQICVAMFMFLGGIGLYISIQNNKKIIDLIFSLYKKLWSVFIIYIPIGFLLYHDANRIWSDDPVSCSVFENFSLIEFFLAFLGLQNTYNKEWWFFKTYICCLLIGCLFIYATKKIKNVSFHLVVIVMFYALTHFLFPAIAETENYAWLTNNFIYFNFFMIQVTASCFLLGIVFAKFQLIDKMSALWDKLFKNKLVSTVFSFVFILTTLILRFRVFGEEGDLLLISFMILFCLKFATGNRIIEKTLIFFGKYSASMWLIHTFYCYYFYHTAMLVYLTRNVVISYTTFLLLTTASAWGISSLQRLLNSFRLALIMPCGEVLNSNRSS